MNSVFILQHSYDLEGCEQTKFIGVYSSRAEASSAIERLKLQPGFCDRPKCFFIEEYKLNQDHWMDGYVTMTIIQVKDINGKWKSVGATERMDGTYEITEKYENDVLAEFKDGDIVRCTKRRGILYATEKAA